MAFNFRMPIPVSTSNPNPESSSSTSSLFGPPKNATVVSSSNLFAQSTNSSSSLVSTSALFPPPPPSTSSNLFGPSTSPFGVAQQSHNPFSTTSSTTSSSNNLFAPSSTTATAISLSTTTIGGNPFSSSATSSTAVGGGPSNLFTSGTSSNLFASVAAASTSSIGGFTASGFKPSTAAGFGAEGKEKDFSGFSAAAGNDPPPPNVVLDGGTAGGLFSGGDGPPASSLLVKKGVDKSPTNYPPPSVDDDNENNAGVSIMKLGLAGANGPTAAAAVSGSSTTSSNLFAGGNTATTSPQSTSYPFTGSSGPFGSRRSDHDSSSRERKEPTKHHQASGGLFSTAPSATSSTSLFSSGSSTSTSTGGTSLFGTSSVPTSSDQAPVGGSLFQQPSSKLSSAVGSNNSFPKNSTKTSNEEQQPSIGGNDNQEEGISIFKRAASSAFGGGSQLIKASNEALSSKSRTKASAEPPGKASSEGKSMFKRSYAAVAAASNSSNNPFATTAAASSKDHLSSTSSSFGTGSGFGAKIKDGGRSSNFAAFNSDASGTTSNFGDRSDKSSAAKSGFGGARAAASRSSGGLFGSPPAASALQQSSSKSSRRGSSNESTSAFLSPLKRTTGAPVLHKMAARGRTTTTSTSTTGGGSGIIGTSPLSSGARAIYRRRISGNGGHSGIASSASGGGLSSVATGIVTNLDRKLVETSKTIKLFGVPKHQNNREFLFKRFKHFGYIDKISSKPNGIAYITYSEHNSAATAKAKGTVLTPGSRAIRITWVVKPSAVAKATAESGAAAATKTDLDNPNNNNPLAEAENAGSATSASKTYGAELTALKQQVLDSASASKPSSSSSSSLSMASSSTKPLFPAFDAASSAFNNDNNSARPSTTMVKPSTTNIFGGSSPSSARNQDNTTSGLSLFMKINNSSVPHSSSSSSNTGQSTQSTFPSGYGTTGGFTLVQNIGGKADRALPRTEIAQLLKPLIGRTAVSLYDKYVLLEERDKILRKGRARRGDVQTISAQTGTCLDMCFEKERYIREVQKRVSIYEMNADGTIDPKIAVKDYSRSSADQEEPLPHELRPAPILLKTMNYLYGEIANNPPDPNDDSANLSQWYDFLWNRTRAIRKDITQQMLMDEKGVDLVEKCSRLHIFASHHLCQLEIAEFDQKMNTENLTKCLQTLRHMYEDCEKSGIVCEKENEFRAYDILLNLNSADILRQVGSYRPEIRNSPQVRQALSLLRSVQNNNWVKFFQLTRSSNMTYLESCLAHRYINQVRTAALKTMAVAYKHSEYPVSLLRETLAFETERDLITFAALHGIQTSENNDLKMTKTETPEETPDIKRSYILVDSKMEGYSLGEILNGGPLIHETFVEPVGSFDVDHRYSGSDPVIQSYFMAEAELAEASRQEAAKRQQQMEIADMASTILSKVIVECVSEEVSKPVERAVIDHTADSVVDRMVESEVRRIAEDTHRHHRMAADKRRKQDAKDQLLVDTESVCKDLIISVIAETVASVAEEEIKAIQRIEERKRFDAERDRLAGEVLNEMIDKVIRERLKAAHYIRVIVPLKRLEGIAENLRRIRIMKFVTKWRKTVANRIYRRNLVRDFPQQPPMKTVAEAAAALRSINPHKRAVSSSPLTPLAALRKRSRWSLQGFLIKWHRKVAERKRHREWTDALPNSPPKLTLAESARRLRPPIRHRVPSVRRSTGRLMRITPPFSSGSRLSPQKLLYQNLNNTDGYYYSSTEPEDQQQLMNIDLNESFSSSTLTTQSAAALDGFSLPALFGARNHRKPEDHYDLMTEAGDLQPHELLWTSIEPWMIKRTFDGNPERYKEIRKERKQQSSSSLSSSSAVLGRRGRLDLSGGNSAAAADDPVNLMDLASQLRQEMEDEKNQIAESQERYREILNGRID